MTPEEIEVRLSKIETTLEENADALTEANKVRDEVQKIKAAVLELAEAMKLLDQSYSRKMQGKAGHIDIAADRVIARLKQQ